MWLTCRRLRQESEYACDDAVLGAGVVATTYADHLLDIARQLSHRATVWAAAPAIAHPSTLERRIVAVAISLPLAAASLAEPEVIVLPEPQSIAEPLPQPASAPGPVAVIAPAPIPVPAVAPRSSF